MSTALGSVLYYTNVLYETKLSKQKVLRLYMKSKWKPKSRNVSTLEVKVEMKSRNSQNDIISHDFSYI